MLRSDLERELANEVSGDVHFEPGWRHLYATDASNFRMIPIGVVLPRSVDDLVAIMSICHEHGTPVMPRGAGTSLAGQGTNMALIVDTSRYMRSHIDLDVGNQRATVESGVVLDDLQRRAAPAGLVFGVDPSTSNRCTLGGMIGNNACGIRSVRNGRMVDNVVGLRAVLSDGTIVQSSHDSNGLYEDSPAAKELNAALRRLGEKYRDEIVAKFPNIPRRVSGYNLDALLPATAMNIPAALTGTEGTCVLVADASVRLLPAPAVRNLCILSYRDLTGAAYDIPDLLELEPSAIEAVDRRIISGLFGDSHPAFVRGSAWLVVEFAGDSAEVGACVKSLLASGTGRCLHVTHIDSESEQRAIWDIRKSGLGATSFTAKGQQRWPGWEDAAVAPSRLGDYVADFSELIGRYGFDAAIYGHFGDGCVHCRIDFDLTTAEGIATYKRFLGEAAELVSSYDGSYSGEHGDGQQRGMLLEKMYGPEIVAAFREFKALWDPTNRMNPGKVVDAYEVDQNLRFGADFGLPIDVELRFGYPDDEGSFARAQMRCVGVGKCRRDDGSGTMCPSYMVTHEEMHSTRGRARLLFEMLKPDSQLNGWRDETVKEALDLCLSCKGCVTDCPVNVDIPTYKAEFLLHHYEGRLHPRVHYAMGLIDVWSRIASWMPGLANFALSTPGLGTVLKKAAGVATERPVPRFAERTFRDWFTSRESRNPGGPRVLLFDDTFTNHFHPEVGEATVEVLESYGYQVTLPPRVFCCGRPLYDYGFLDLAHRYLDRLIDTVRDDVAAGTRIVGVEPSCLAVFKDELVQMKAHETDARRIADATYSLAGFLVEEGVELPALDRRAIVQGHCHHKGSWGLGDLTAVLDGMGLQWRELDAGCCGLAGSFGFEAGDKFKVSVAAGERKLMPAVRDADRATLIVADGFSCRTQITHLQAINGAGDAGERRALHLAQVIRMAQQKGRHGTTVGDTQA